MNRNRQDNRNELLKNGWLDKLTIRPHRKFIVKWTKYFQTNGQNEKQANGQTDKWTTGLKNMLRLEIGNK